jgi:asparagine synthase (glutamine-hydrolysing)
MCGIAGILHFDRDKAVESAVLERMTNVLSHRGPDGKAFFVKQNIGLGHTRLAIIDLSTGDQPMFSKDRNLVIVYNGEIYNYLELKEELKSLGHNFNTASDTEVILSAYEEWGFDCQNKFNGMWAFALWDMRERHLFLSRDRIGEKPLHYSTRDNSFFFGSEIKSLLASGYTYGSADHLWSLYLSLGYVPAPYTLYSGISKLIPGHFLIVKDGNVKEQKYWDLPSVDEKDMRRDEPKVLEEFESYFADSVKIRMRCDVPFGAFLSGGLDSSSVVAAMAQESGSPVETFTIGFAEKSFDERALAQQVATLFGTHHHEQIVEPEAFDESLQKVVSQFDEPFGDASAVPVGLVSGLARKNVTVALTGDGGDEVLSGYPSYVNEKFAAQYRKVPAPIRAVLYQSTNLACSMARHDMRYRLNRLKRFLYLSDVSFDERFTTKMSLLDGNPIRDLIPKDIPQLPIEDYLSDVFAKCGFTDPFYRLMYFNLKVSLPDDMLAKVDRMSMAHSLETRVPFLDHRLVELTYGVSKNVKLSGYRQKHLLKETFGKRLPVALVKGPKKSLRVPLREWFKQKEFEDKLKELQEKDFGLRPAVIGDIVNATKTGRQDYGDFIWRLFVLQKWVNDGGRARPAWTGGREELPVLKKPQDQRQGDHNCAHV